jgi:hypothetical protein
VIEKLYSDPFSAEWVSYFGSGKYHQTLKRINLISLYDSDIDGNSVPVNSRIYDQKQGKTKNHSLITFANNIFPRFTPSASVAFEDYQAVLERIYEQIPLGRSVTLLADRGFDLSQSRLRDAQRLTSLVMLLDMTHLIAVVVGMLLVEAANPSQLDWHGERGLSFL